LKKFFGVVIGVGAALLLGALPPASAQKAMPLAKAGSQTITSVEIKSLLDTQTDEVRRQLLANPKQLEEFVKTEAERKAVLTEAKKAGVDKRPDVAVLMQRLQEQAVLSAYLGPQITPPKDYPGDAEITSYYEKNKERFLVPEQVNVSTIFLVVLPAWAQDKGLEEKVRTDAQRLAAEARKGGDFAALARLHSQDRPTAENGGAVGWVTAAQLLPELAEAASRMKPGDISEPIRVQLGYHVIRVNDRKPGAQRPLSEVRPAVIQLLVNDYRAKKEREAIEAAVRVHPVSTDTAIIEKWRAEEASTAARK
jgi:parvulin-like peptidyl-prolyl isomerase